MSVLKLHSGDALNYSPASPLDQSRKLIIHPRGPHSAPAADVTTTPTHLPVDRLHLLIDKSKQTAAKDPDMD